MVRLLDQGFVKGAREKVTQQRLVREDLLEEKIPTLKGKEVEMHPLFHYLVIAVFSFFQTLMHVLSNITGATNAEEGSSSRGKERPVSREKERPVSREK